MWILLGAIVLPSTGVMQKRGSGSPGSKRYRKAGYARGITHKVVEYREGWNFLTEPPLSGLIYKVSRGGGEHDEFQKLKKGQSGTQW